MNREQWFLERIGKTVFRNQSCKCKSCTLVYENGIVISDREHASYLHECEAEFNSDGTPLKYFDTKQERDLFELSLIASK